MPPFQIAPKDGPGLITPPGGTIRTAGASDAKQRAIDILMGKQAAAQDNPVQNPTQVSPEELSAIAPKTQPIEAEAEKGQTTTIESTQEEAPKEDTPAKEDTLSKQYAILARKEKNLRAQVQSLSEKERALKLREDAIATKDQEYQSKYISKDTILQDPWTVLASLGISYEQLTEQALNQTQQDPYTKAYLQKMENELKSIKEQQEKALKSNEDNQKKQYEQAVNQIRSETKQLVNSDPAFETIKEMNAVNDVVELIEETFKSDGILLSVEEAAKAVEDHLMEEAVKLAKLKKIQQRLAPAAAAKPATATQASSSESPKQTQMKTLTNQVASTRQLSARERALLAFRGELK